MIVAIAWRNIWRNRLRSLVILLSISLGITGGLFAVSFARDFSAQLVSHTLELENTHLLLRARSQDGDGQTQHISHADEIIAQLRALPGVAQTVRRIRLHAAVSSAHASANIQISGIHPDEESKVNGLADFTIKGSYFEEEMYHPVFLGSSLAEDLDLDLNARLVATFQNPDGELVSTVFQVTGIYSTRNPAFERRHAFVQHDHLALIKKLNDDQTAEIGIQLEGGPGSVRYMQPRIQQAFPDHEVLSWKQMRPEVAFFYDYIGIVNTCIAGIILFALSMGVINTMLMAVRERARETAMLRAIGMNNQRMYTMIVMETLFLTLLGAAGAMVLSSVIMHWTSTTGIDLSPFLEGGYAQGRTYFQAETMVTRVYPAFTLIEFIRFGIMVVITGLLAAIWPARMMLRQGITETFKRTG